MEKSFCSFDEVPLYMTLGLAVAFALTFSIVDAWHPETLSDVRIIFESFERVVQR